MNEIETRERTLLKLAERTWPALQKAWIAIVELTDGGPPVGSDLAKLLDEMQRCEASLKTAIRALVEREGE